MEKEFVPYEQALAIKELGFDESCFGFYSINNEHFKDGHFHISTENLFSTDIEPIQQQLYCISAPLYQQAFRFFREEYNLHSIFEYDSDNYYYVIQGVNDFNFAIDSSEDGDVYQTYEETEPECLNKLIEIVKQQKN